MWVPGQTISGTVRCALVCVCVRVRVFYLDSLVFFFRIFFCRVNLRMTSYIAVFHCPPPPPMCRLL